MKFLFDIKEDLSYYQISLEKQAFLNTKNIQKVYNNATLAFVNSKDKCVFYQKESKR